MSEIKFGIIEKYFLSEKPFVFYLYVFIFTLLMLLVLCLVSYNHKINNKVKHLESVSNRLNYLLTDVFSATSHQMVYMGKQINESNYKDLFFIHSLLNKTRGKEYKSKNIFSWTLFDWVDSKNMQTVNQVKGVMKKPLDMSKREYTLKCRKSPWILQLSTPAIGSPSDIWVIPAAIGVSSENNKFLGMLAVGFNVLELNEILLEKMPDEKANFIIADENLNIILSSGKTNYFESEKLGNKKLFDNDLKNIASSSGFFDKQVKYDDITYYVYKKMNDYPYIILLGFNYELFLKEFLLSVLPSVFQIVGMGIFAITLIYFVRKKIIDIGRSSNKAKEDLIVHINQRLDVNLDIVLQYSDILIRYLNGEIKVGINQERQLDLLSHIHKAASNAKNIDNNLFELSEIDLNKIVERSIDVHSMTVLQRDLFLKRNLNDSPLLVKGDELYLKQIIVSLLSFCIEHTHLGEGILISSFSLNKLAILKFFYICFELADNDIKRIKKNIDNNHYFDLEHVVKIIELHLGTFNVEQVGSQKIITVTLPLIA